MSFITLGICQWVFRCSTKYFRLPKAANWVIWAGGDILGGMFGISKGWFCSLAIGGICSCCPWGGRVWSINTGVGLFCGNRLHINNVNRDCFARSLFGVSPSLGLIGVGLNSLNSAVVIWQSFGVQFSAKTSLSPFFCFQFRLGTVRLQKVPCF